MSRMRKEYKESEKLSFLREFYESGMSKSSFCRLHNISTTAVLNGWIKKYSSTVKALILPEEPASESDMANRSKESYREENAQLKKRIKELEKSLSFSRLETEARDLMITRAEEYFNIQIRKKSGAK